MPALHTKRNPSPARSGNRRGKMALSEWMILRGRRWQHLRFWVLAFLILFWIFKTADTIEKIDVIYTLIFLVPIVLIVYVNLYLLIPRLLRTERYLFYGLGILALATGGALFLYMLFQKWIDLILPGYYFISYYDVWTLMIFTGSFLVLTTLLKLSRGWFKLMRMERMQATRQLQSLQSQINPHFLLNSLQTIYALSLEKSEHGPEAILQLSDILKYTLYETDQPRVELHKEIGMIKNYVEMYRRRVDPRQARIDLQVKGDPGEALIAPMILLPFIENSFKHGLARADSSFVRILLDIQGLNLNFEVSNSCSRDREEDLEQKGGIGIENTRQRLDLLYPGRYRLEIDEKEPTFTVRLRLALHR
jgi:hypothetical protein